MVRTGGNERNEGEKRSGEGGGVSEVETNPPTARDEVAGELVQSPTGNVALGELHEAVARQHPAPGEGERNDVRGLLTQQTHGNVPCVRARREHPSTTEE